MNRNRQGRILAFFLAILILIPNFAFANERVSMDVSNNGNKTTFTIYGEKDRNVSISVKDSNRYYFVDQARIDTNGSVEFLVELEYDKDYDVLVNLDGEKLSEKLSIKRPETGGSERPEDPDGGIDEPISHKASLYIKGYRGVVLDERSVEIIRGESVLDFTTRLLDKNNISYENRSGYLASIDGMAEFDKGETSGWMYSVNGDYPNAAADDIILSSGDRVEWKYTYDLGEDLGADVSQWKNSKEDKTDKKLDKELKEHLDKINFKNIKEHEINDELVKVSKILSSKNYKSKNDKDILKDAQNILDTLVAVRNRFTDKEEAKKFSKNIINITANINSLIGKNSKIGEVEKISKILSRNLVIALDLASENSEQVIDTSVNITERGHSLDKENKKEYEKTVELTVEENINLPVNFIEKAKLKNIKKILIDTNSGLVELDPRSFGKIKEDLKLSVDTNKDEIKIVLLEGKKPIGKIDKLMKVRIPFNTNNEDNLVVKAEDGSLVGGIYDKKSKSIIFTTNKPGKFTIIKNDVSFKDLDSYKWAKKPIESLAAKGLIKGNGEGYFLPAENITRAEFVTLINRAMKYEKVSSGVLEFKDVNPDKWYYDEIGIAYNLGIIKGKDVETFDPEGSITREEISKILGEILLRDSFKSKSKDGIKKYNDGDKVSKWAENEVAMLVGQEILKGDSTGNLNPKSNASRAEAAIMLDRLYYLLLIN